jgi:hypothetical protein
MTVTLNLPPQVEQAYLAEAQARGLPLEEVVREVLVAARPATPASELSPEEWVCEFREWTESHRGLNLPILSDEDISRESIYADRGL